MDQFIVKIIVKVEKQNKKHTYSTDCKHSIAIFGTLVTHYYCTGFINQEIQFDKTQIYRNSALHVTYSPILLVTLVNSCTGQKYCSAEEHIFQKNKCYNNRRLIVDSLIEHNLQFNISYQKDQQFSQSRDSVALD